MLKPLLTLTLLLSSALVFTTDAPIAATLENSSPESKGLAIAQEADRRDTGWVDQLSDLKMILRNQQGQESISSANKSGPYMRSEFAYEDISSQEVGKYNYKWLRDEPLNDQDCFVIERYPLDKNSGYTRQVAWIDKATYQPLKVDYYDRKNTLLKTQTFSDYQLYLDKFWRPDSMEMINHQTGKSTVLLMDNFRFGNGFSDRDFTKNALKNAR